MSRRGAAGAPEALEAKAVELTGALGSTAEATVARIERTAAYTRTGYHTGGTGEYRDAAGVTAAYFIQHTSREGDPQLHVHIAILNRVQRSDQANGKYRTLDSEAMYRQRLGIAAFTNRTMATKLTDLGYVLVPHPDGNGFEIGGVDADVMEAFSSRRAQVTPELERLVEEYRRWVLRVIRYEHRTSPQMNTGNGIGVTVIAGDVHHDAATLVVSAPVGRAAPPTV